MKRHIYPSHLLFYNLPIMNLKTDIKKANIFKYSEPLFTLLCSSPVENLWTEQERELMTTVRGEM